MYVRSICSWPGPFVARESKVCPHLGWTHYKLNVCLWDPPFKSVCRGQTSRGHTCSSGSATEPCFSASPLWKSWSCFDTDFVFFQTVVAIISCFLSPRSLSWSLPPLTPANYPPDAMAPHQKFHLDLLRPIIQHHSGAASLFQSSLVSVFFFLIKISNCWILFVLFFILFFFQQNRQCDGTWKPEADKHSCLSAWVSDAWKSVVERRGTPRVCLL